MRILILASTGQATSPPQLPTTNTTTSYESAGDVGNGQFLC